MGLLGLRVVVEGRTVEIPAGGQADIGRSEVCDIRVADPRIDLLHAVVWDTSEGWHLADRDSAGGTWAGDRRIDQALITEPLDLRLGDRDDGTPVRFEPFASDAAVAIPAAPIVRPGRSQRTVSLPTGALHGRHEATDLVRIGRDDDNDVILDDLLVSRHHAELRTTADGNMEIVDLRSLNGTFLNGARVQRARVEELDLIGVGHSEFRLVGGQLEEYVDAGEVTFEAKGVTVTGRNGATLVEDVSFSLPEHGLLAVVGPSGAGKSSLLHALSGARPAATGTVLFGGRDLYVDYAELRQRIGVVPQDDILHGELTLHRALAYAGRLRFPPDVDAGHRNARIDEVLEDLGLAHRADSPIRELSGGERKRTNVALELLTQPSLLLLDEPVSGLDPGLARVLMQLLRRLADDGREVIVVTHDVASLSLCDQVLVLAPGGIPAYVGPPAGAPGRFGQSDIADVFTDLSNADRGAWRLEPRPDPAALPSLPGAAPRRAAPPPPGAPTPSPVPTRVRADRRTWWSQLRTLTVRYLDVLASDRRNALLLLLQAPILGLLLLVALPAGELGPPATSVVRLVSAAGIVLFVLLVGATWLGANNAVREIARELPMLRRERSAGLSLSAYVLSKALVLGALTVTQTVVLVALATARQDGPADGVVLGWGVGELMVVVALAGLASMALALLLSALAGSPERATSVLPVVLILQLVLAAGVVLPEIVDRPVLRELSLVSSTQWGVAGAASTVDLDQLQVFDDRLRDLRSVDANDPDAAVEALAATPEPDSRWAHETGAWSRAVLALIALIVVPLIATALALRRYDPGRT